MVTDRTSLRAKLFMAQLRLTRAKQTYADVGALHDSIRHRPAADEIEPPRRVRRRLLVHRTTVRGRPCYTLAPITPFSTRKVL